MLVQVQLPIIQDVTIKDLTLYKELITNKKISDVSFTLLNASLKKETGKELMEEKDYHSLELITKDGKVTNAGLLLSDQGGLVQSRIFCT